MSLTSCPASWAGPTPLWASPAEKAGAELVVILGLEPDRIAGAPRSKDFLLPSGFADGEVLCGSAIAHRFGLRPGQSITLKVADMTLPFRVSSILPRNASIWSAQLVCMTLADAGKLFARPAMPPTS